MEDLTDEESFEGEKILISNSFEEIIMKAKDILDLISSNDFEPTKTRNLAKEIIEIANKVQEEIHK